MVELKLRSDTMDRHQAEEAVRTILNYIEKTNRKDPPREGLEQTPERVISMFDEIFSGYQQDPSEILDSTFNGEGYDGIVLLKNIEFHSTCEHHLQPFSGHGHIAYIPVDRIVGISKLARLLDAHSKRLQNQERITKDIAEDLVNHLSPLGAAVILEASHGCMKCRGVMKQNSTMVTSSMKGAFFDNKEARNELMQLIKE
ncbi:MAG: GTP cyclohydrolase I FolE [Methanobacteriota archaeon]|jgi:GTP cyclohydrolase I|nr:GTP cyclohydrolase I FolE [Euryarchaeota archaeon]RAH08186.1 MAG: GTP cyclohydrolase I FolE [Euryarchaeota archaeon]|tara:strand:- start:681 stop:1280 length:600 start_codon:yes stop_codon:yes gene_type:complete